MPAAIDAPAAFRGIGLAAWVKFGNPFGFLDGFLRKVKRQIVIAQDGKHIDALFVGRTEHLDDLSFGIGMAGFPGVKFHHDFVANIRRPPRVARRRHIDIVGNARVVGNDEQELFAALQRADDLRSVCVSGRERPSR